MTDPYAEYVGIPAINWSAAKDLDISPRLFAHRRKHPRPDTDALFFGRAFHCALLEPDRFPDEYVIAPDFGDLRAVEGRTTKEEGKANKTARNEWLAANAGKTALDADDGDRIAHMVASIRGHRAAMSAIVGATEETIRWTDAATGLACKARLDTFRAVGVTDLKTCLDPSPRGFGAAAGRYLYHGQIAFYHDGVIAAGRCVAPDLPLIVAIQNCEPWDVAVYRVDHEALEAGRALYRRLLKRFAECTAADWWPGCAPEIVPLRLPEWALRADTDTRPESEDF